MVGQNNSNLPPGFRFHPTDEELIVYYLRNQASSRPCPISMIPEVDIYKFDPWDLPEKSDIGENEWYFFTPRDRKYPNGVRPNRAAVSGYWKATGTDKAIYSGSKYVGIKKALVFYKGKPPKGIKTDWIMHEYRLNESKSQPNKKNGSMRLDDWVLCRIYKKKSLGNTSEQRVEDSFIQTQSASSVQAEPYKFPRTYSISNLWEFDYMNPISQLLNENSYINQETLSNDMGNYSVIGFDKYHVGRQEPYTSEMKFQVNQPTFLD